MAKLITAVERIQKAQKLIEKARAVPPPSSTTLLDLSYVAQVKDLLQQARDLIKFISYRPGASQEEKNEAADLFIQIDRAEKELLHHHLG
jgi:hypothetical protein